MAEEYQYQKERQQFGRHAAFEDTETRIVGSVNQNKATADEMYVLRDPNKVVLDNIPQMSEHRVSNAICNVSNQSLNLGQYREDPNSKSWNEARCRWLASPVRLH